MSLRFLNGAFKLKGVQTVKYEVEVPQPKPAAVVEVPTVAPEPVVVPTVAPSQVEAPAEVAEAAPEAGLVPEDPPTE